MLDADLIKECADPSLKPAIVEQFVAAAGSTNPFEVTVKAGGRLILVPMATSAEQAMTIVRQYVGQAVVRVGLTQFPAGIGIKDVADLKPDLVNQCENLRKGTGMFAKVLRIVAKWYGNPKSREVFPQIFEDAVYAWRTGEFEGVNVFRADDPGTPVAVPKQLDGKGFTEEGTEATPTEEPSETEQDVGRAGIRINLSRIGAEPQH
jgi:hypothetical protein